VPDLIDEALTHIAERCRYRHPHEHHADQRRGRGARAQA
jgi:hypothetical protein